jgi:pantoate--beta-alanine ligase
VDDIYDGEVLSQPFDFDGLENGRKIQTTSTGRNSRKASFEIVTQCLLWKRFPTVTNRKKMVSKQPKSTLLDLSTESNGLAMSSRAIDNQQEKRSLILKTLNLAKENSNQIAHSRNAMGRRIVQNKYFI